LDFLSAAVVLVLMLVLILGTEMIEEENDYENEKELAD
jgi:hypothetical protein